MNFHNMLAMVLLIVGLFKNLKTCTTFFSLQDGRSTRTSKCSWLQQPLKTNSRPQKSASPARKVRNWCFSAYFCSQVVTCLVLVAVGMFGIHEDPWDIFLVPNYKGFIVHHKVLVYLFYFLGNHPKLCLFEVGEALCHGKVGLHSHIGEWSSTP